ncbi:MAG: WD40 repeat protein/serine/threonine protein kinase [Verrucomicrobiales bacterium]|jgi:WD40 repeat protein/serine/threonine protein kinase
MKEQQQHREEEIFIQALEIEAGLAREAYLDTACGGDATLREKVGKLVAAHEEPAAILGALGGMGAPTGERARDQIGSYELLEELGAGGMGTVWLAQQSEPVVRKVALKIIKMGMDTQQVIARFEAERQALALMDHPNIAKVFDAGATDTGRPYFVMELVKGISITRHCDQEKLGIKDSLDLFIKACQAIQHAHQKGIIHRDIKPSNIMVTLHDRVPVPKVIDFGIAKATQQELTQKTIYTQNNQFIGTPAYMSPEQADMSGLDIDTRSDIYSLGVLLYELLTGSTPFDSAELMNSGLDEMRKIIREREPVRPSTKFSQTLVAAEVTRLKLDDEEREKVGASSRRPLPPIPADLDWIVMKCLEKDRSRRYDSANGLAADLKRHLNDEPVTACPPTTTYRFQKAFRRNKLVFTAGAAVAAALLIGIGVSTWQTLVAREAQTEAEALGEEADTARAATEYANYVSQIGLAAANLEQGNQGMARDALLATPPEHRNWEWGHLVNEAWPPDIDSDSLIVRSREPNDTVAAYWGGAKGQAIVSLNFEEIATTHPIASSKDGKRVFSAPDGNIHAWEARTGVKKVTIFVSHGMITSFAMSHADSSVAAGDTGGITRLVDAETHEILWRYPKPGKPIKSDRKSINLVWFSPNDRYVVVGYFGGAIDVLDGKSGLWVTEFLEHSTEVTSLQFLPDDQEVVTASRDGSVRVWDLNTGREVGETKSAPYQGTKGISVQAINPKNLEEVATGDYDGALYLWDRMIGKKLATDFPKGIDGISYLYFSNDGSCLFVVEGDKNIRVLDRKSGTELAAIPSPNEFHRVALSPDNERILTASGSGRAQIWAPVHSKSDVTNTLDRAHNDIVIQASFSSDGSRIVTASYDKTVKVWDTASQKLLRVFLGHTHELLSADFSPDGRRIVSVDTRGVSRVWDSWTGKEIFHQEFGSNVFFTAAESRNGLRGGVLLGNIAGVSSNPFSPSVHEPKVVVNSAQGLVVRGGVDGSDSFLLKGGQNVAWPVIDPSGDLVAAMTDALDVIKVWDLNTGELKYTLEGHTDKAFWAEFSHDSKRIVTGSSDKTAIVWDAIDGAKLFTLSGHKGFVSVARFSSDDERIATSAFGIEALIWNARNGKLLSTLKSAKKRITNVEFNPDPGLSRVLTTGIDNVVHVWDPTGPVGREVLQITRDSTLIYAKWSPDGRTILSCWKDGVVQLYKTIPMDAFAEITDADEMERRIGRWREAQLQ